MDRVPEAPTAIDLLEWIAYELDAAWTAKLAILRAERIEEIAHWGACLREHERHAEELTRLARMVDRDVTVPTDVPFITREPHIVGAIADSRTLLEAMERLEAVRADRYEAHPPAVGGQPAAMIRGVFERHLADTRARLESIRRLRRLSAFAAA